MQLKARTAQKAQVLP